MPYGKSDGPFNLKEGDLKVGTWTNPETIGTDATDPVSKFTGDSIGYIMQGSMNIGITRAYAEALADTPGVAIRKDLIRKQFMIECQLFQRNADLLQLAMGLLVQASYAVTIPSAQTWDIAHIGSDEPTGAADKHGFLLSTRLTNGKPFYVAMYAGRVTTEDIGLALSGTAHATTNFRAEAFPHSGFVTDDAAQKYYGAWLINQT